MKEELRYFYLMHKNVCVASIALNESGQISKLNEVYNKNHFPICYDLNKPESIILMYNGLRNWWSCTREIPKERLNFENILNAFKLNSPSELVLKTYGLSLSDHYWILEQGKNLTWEDVNFFTNFKKNEIGRVLLNPDAQKKDISNWHGTDPSLTATGRLPKGWFVENGKLVMFKGGSEPFFQEPYNEVIGSRCCKRLNLEHVNYSTVARYGKSYSKCECITSQSLEYIPAYLVMSVAKRRSHESMLEHYLKCCEMIGGERQSLFESNKKLAIVDSIIANNDRHQNNFGLLRDADTLKVISAFPAFDFGNSLWLDCNLSCGKFYVDNYAYPKEQIALPRSSQFRIENGRNVELFGKIEPHYIDDLYGITDEIRDIIFNIHSIPAIRKDAIIYGVKYRVNHLKKLTK